MIRAAALATLIGACAWATARASVAHDVEAKIETALAARADVVARAQRTLNERAVVRAETLATRARVFYRLSRGGGVRAVLEPELAATRGLARRLTIAAADELAATHKEIEHLRRQSSELAAARAKTNGAAAVLPETLVQPVSGHILEPFVRDRGVWLAPDPGAPIVAPAAGTIAYVGPIRGLGTSVVIAHEHHLVTVVGPVTSPRVRRGRVIESGAPIGKAAATPIYVELRVKTPAGAFAVDPAPFWSER